MIKYHNLRQIEIGETYIYLCSINKNETLNTTSFDTDLTLVSDNKICKNLLINNIDKEDNILNIIKRVSMYDNYDLKYFPNKKLKNSNRSINFESILLLDNKRSTFENELGQWSCCFDDLDDNGQTIYNMIKNDNNDIVILTFIKS